MVLQQMLWFNIGDAKAFNRGCSNHPLGNKQIGTIIESGITFLFIVNRTFNLHYEVHYTKDIYLRNNQTLVY